MQPPFNSFNSKLILFPYKHKYTKPKCCSCKKTVILSNPPSPPSRIPTQKNVPETTPNIVPSQNYFFYHFVCIFLKLRLHINLHICTCLFELPVWIVHSFIHHFAISDSEIFHPTKPHPSLVITPMSSTTWHWPFRPPSPTTYSALTITHLISWQSLPPHERNRWESTTAITSPSPLFPILTLTIIIRSRGGWLGPDRLTRANRSHNSNLLNLPWNDHIIKYDATPFPLHFPSWPRATIISQTFIYPQKEQQQNHTDHPLNLSLPLIHPLSDATTTNREHTSNRVRTSSHFSRYKLSNLILPIHPASCFTCSMVAVSPSYPIRRNVHLMA